MSVSSENQEPIFHIHPQSTALSTFLPILRPHLPYSNPLYGRLQAPHNLPTRHCLFSATFPPSESPLTPPKTPEIYTILFSDRSRHNESQIWLFNPLITSSFPQPLSSTHRSILSTHILATIHFLKHIAIPQAPGWPFTPLLRFACLHENITSALFSLNEGKDFIPYFTIWKLWLISISPAALSSLSHSRSLPENYTVSRVPSNQIDIVLSTSIVQRQPSTLMLLPSIGILSPEGRLAAWGYIGIDASFATLYVVPEQRGKGLASFVARELLGRLGRGEYKDLGYAGENGWVHSDVKKGNVESEGVMKVLGGKVGWESSYLHVDCDKIS